jgi:hypothetical protein
MQVRIIALLCLRSRVKLVPTSGIYIYIYNFHSLNFSIIDFPSLRRSFPFCFLFFLLCGLVYTLAARHMMYRSVQYGQYTARYSTEKTNKNRWEKNKKCKTVWRTWNDLDIYINILTAVPQKFMNSLYVSQILSYSQKKTIFYLPVGYSMYAQSNRCPKKKLFSFCAVLIQPSCSHMNPS